MYSAIYEPVRKAVWPGGPEIRRYLRLLERTEWLPREELQAWQLTQARQLLADAYTHVPYYHDAFQRAGIHPEDVKDWRDFGALPFLTRQDVKARIEQMVDPAYRHRLRRGSTSGSTGQPMVFYQDLSLFRLSGAVEYRSRKWYGVRPGDKMAWFWSQQRDLPHEGWTWAQRLAARIKRHRYLNVYAMSEAAMRAFAEMLTRWQPHMFRSNPSVLALFTRYAQQHGYDRIRPRFIECTAEKLTRPQRRLFEAFYGASVADVYALEELHEVAYQCPEGRLHVLETRVVEVVDDAGRALPPGEVGQIVVTALFQPGMPFIRYKTGDVGILSDETCPCGRGMPVMQEITGRRRDFTVTADGTYVYASFFAFLFEGAPHVLRYQVYQPDREHLEVRLQCHAPPDPAWLAHVRGQLQIHFGPATHIDIHRVDKIDWLSSGKHRYVISDVAPDFVRD